MVLYDKINEDLPLLEKRLKTNLSLPKIETTVLKHYINVCEGDLGEAEKLIELNYSVRAANPNVFFERDPFDSGIKQMMASTDVIYLPDLTPENYVIQISRIVDPDPEKYMFVESVKSSSMIYDILFRTIAENKIIDGIITIYDVSGFSLKHLARVNLTVLRAFSKFYEKTIALRIQQIHLINCPSYMNKIMAVFKPFLSDHINKMINFHEPNSDSLFNHLAKELVPVEFGGTSKSLPVAKQQQIKDLEKYRDYLMDLSYWKLKSESEQAEPMQGSFKSLSFD